MTFEALNASLLILAYTCFIFVAVTLLSRWIIRAYRFRVLIGCLPKGPRPIPIFGNTLDFLGGNARVLELMQIEWPRIYGEIYVTYIGSTCNVNISSPELMEIVMKNLKIIDKGSIYRFIKPWLGDGLLVSTGSKWKKRRRLMTPAFHFQILDKFMDVFNEQSFILCKVLNQHQEVNHEIDICPIVGNCTLDIICETSMGVSVNAQTKQSAYARAVYRMNQIIMERYSKPWLANNFVFYLTPIGRELCRLLHILHPFTQSVISKRREMLRTGPCQRDCNAKVETTEVSGYRKRMALLDILLEVESDKENEGLTDKDIQEEIDTFMFEGHDTTMSAISWLLYSLASNPEHQERVWAELDEVFGESDRYCTQQDLINLTYLDCCIKESLRLYSVAPHIERYLKEDFQLGKYLIPSGTNIVLLLYGLHHNPRLYPNPSVYNPERFLPSESQGRHPYAYVPFSAGLRNCIGQRFALLEVKVVVTNFLRHFKVSESPSSAEPIPSMQLVLKSLNGIRLIVSPRRFV